MKTIPIALQANYNGTPTTAIALKLTRTDGATFGFTSSQITATISGTTYSAVRGLDETSLVATAGFAVDNLELRTIDDGSVFTRLDMLNGLWQNATFSLFRYNWKSPADGVEDLFAGIVGNIAPAPGAIVVEMRGLQQYLQQGIGNVTSRTCRARFADFPTPNGTNRCRLTAGTFTRTGTVSSFASAQVFTSSGLWSAVPTVDYYGEGLLTWTSGANTGARQKIRTYASGGVITLMLPMPGGVQVGDAFSVIAGCRKRLIEDCKTKFSNVPNFAGEPHLPGGDALLNVPEVNV